MIVVDLDRACVPVVPVFQVCKSVTFRTYDPARLVTAVEQFPSEKRIRSCPAKQRVAASGGEDR
jgi:hypothetical protein